MMLGALFSSALGGVALAGLPPSELALASYHAQTGRPEQALAALVPALRADPQDLGAHRVYATLLIATMREGAQAEGLYRLWLAQEPDNTAARVTLAHVLEERNLDAGPWCEEAQSLLSPLPTDPDARAHALQVSFALLGPCGGDALSLQDTLAGLKPTDPMLRAWALGWQRTGLLDREQLAQQEALWAELPLTLTHTMDLWAEDLRGPGLRAERQATTRAVERTLAGTDLPGIWAIWQWADRGGPASGWVLDAGLRLDALDPGWRDRSAQWVLVDGQSHRFVPREVRPDSTEAQEIYETLREATHTPRAEQRLKNLDALVATLPATGALRAAAEAERAAQLTALGRPDEALAARKAAALADPTDPTAVNDWAYEAALQGEDLALAQVAMVRVLALPPEVWDPRGDHWYPDPESFWEAQRSHRASALDTLAWLHFRQGQLAEAQAVQHQALMSAGEPEPVLWLHMALILAAQGQNDLALEYLARGYAAGPLGPDEAALDAEAAALADRLVATRRWAPGGFTGWVQAQPAPGPTPQAADPPEDPDPPSPWVGQRLPDLKLTVDGRRTSLHAVGGVRVVDLWATWCSPCIDGMPHLEEVALAYAPRGVTVLAVSVDDELKAMTSFFAGAGPMGYTVAWAGLEAMEALDVNAIPRVFVIDAEGVVVDSWSGYSPGSTRLEETLDRVLAP